MKKTQRNRRFCCSPFGKNCPPILVLGSRPPLRGVSRALWARNPRRVSERVSRGLPKSLRSLKTVYWAGSSDIFYFCPSSKGRGWGGSEGRGNFSKIRGKRGKKKGGEEGSMQEKGQGHFWEGGVLNIYFLRVEEPP